MFLTGAGLLLHYIQTGKSQTEIVKTIFQFCVNLQLQSVRVCEGVSNLFGVHKQELFTKFYLLKTEFSI